MARRAILLTAPARGLSAMALALVLSGCAVIHTPLPETVTPGLHQVQVDGQALQGEIHPGPAGLQLTVVGARPIGGQEIRVTTSGGLRNDQGALAKKAARATCAAAGGQFREKAIGKYDRAGSWLFAGGCA
ncbi:hypothetical protein [Pseudogemmobacter bohemicus]|uniref:hypothetical protein n=1 Tax=Pseudogemmobacter bohemicus TaxID=2250708 RepID=UPI000DD46CE5|nr:hypothetical protein [Pseudogemmobacter bohemicus]